MQNLDGDLNKFKLGDVVLFPPNSASILSNQTKHVTNHNCIIYERRRYINH